MVKLIEWAKENNAIVVTLSWNLVEKATEALKVLGLYDLFDYHLIDPKPIKHILLKKLLDELEKMNISIPPSRIIYIDDHLWHLNDIRKTVGEVFFIHAHRDCNSYETCKDLMIKYLNRVEKT